jgi:hypothetical protein
MGRLLLGYSAWFATGAFALSACSAAQPAETNAVPQVLTRQRLQQNDKLDRNGDLIYVMGPEQTYILSYSDGRLISSFSKTSGIAGLCSDTSGNVFMPYKSIILEYRHGGTKPVAQLSDGNYVSAGCSVDPLTGNLAVANLGASSPTTGPGNIAIFRNASGSPTFYNTDQISSYLSCGYDASGNLFLDGGSSSKPFVFAELPSGSSTFQIINVTRPLTNPGSVQWDGKYVALGANGAGLIYRVNVSGSVGTVISVTKLYSLKTASINFWVQGDAVMTPAGAHRGKLGIWRYPKGGKVKTVYGVSLQKGHLGGVTVSVKTNG